MEQNPMSCSAISYLDRLKMTVLNLRMFKDTHDSFGISLNYKNGQNDWDNLAVDVEQEFLPRLHKAYEDMLVAKIQEQEHKATMQQLAEVVLERK